MENIFGFTKEMLEDYLQVWVRKNTKPPKFLSGCIAIMNII